MGEETGTMGGGGVVVGVGGGVGIGAGLDSGLVGVTFALDEGVCAICVCVGGGETVGGDWTGVVAGKGVKGAHAVGGFEADLYTAVKTVSELIVIVLDFGLDESAQ